MAQVSIDTVLHLQDFGLERLDEDKAIVGFAEKAANPEPSTSTTATGRFYPLSLPIEQRYGGFREEEFESLTKAFDLIELARNPRGLRA